MEYYITGGLAIVGQFVKQQNLVECVQRVFTAGQVISPFFQGLLGAWHSATKPRLSTVHF